jgi:hypothetical protein
MSNENPKRCSGVATGRREAEWPRGADGRYLSGSTAPTSGSNPGNLVAAVRRDRRSGMHRAFYRRLALPKKYRFLLPMIEGRVSQLADDKGGPENLTAAEVALLDLYRRAHGASLLLLAEAHEKGYIRVAADGSWDLHPGAREIARFAEMERRILMTFGLERRAKPVDPMQALQDAVTEANRDFVDLPAPDLPAATPEGGEQ